MILLLTNKTTHSGLPLNTFLSTELAVIDAQLLSSLPFVTNEETIFLHFLLLLPDLQVSVNAHGYDRLQPLLSLKTNQELS